MTYRVQKVVSCGFVVAMAVAMAGAATFTVTTPNDGGAGSLRQALNDATSAAGADTINFSITGSPPHTISLLTGLPVVPPDTSIFADTQAGYTLSNPAVRIVPGAENAKTQDVFRLSSINAHVRGFHISGFTNNSAFGISGSGHKVAANILVNNLNGVWISGGDNNLVGGYVMADRNIISSNRDIGVRIDGFGVPTANIVAGNFIGTDITGMTAWPNRLSGISAYDAPGTIVSGTSTAIQVISGNPGGGVGMGGTNAIGSHIRGNFIGIDATGMAALSNYYGIVLENAVGVTVGGNITQGFANVISGNDYYGVRVFGTNARNNVIMGNYVGVGTNGVTPVPNRYTGVVVGEGAWSNRVGGTDYGTVNVIGGNGGSGVEISDSNTHHNTVSYNLIGMNRAFAAVANGGMGIYVYQASSNILGVANFIGNSPGGSAGIKILGAGAHGNLVIGNVVGMDNMSNPHPNYGGIDIQDARGTVVGFLAFGGINFVGGNRADGISVRGSASNTLIQGNAIGTDLSGTLSVSNNGTGIYVEGVRTTIGVPGGGNLISGNGGGGIYIGATASNAVIQANFIGVDESGGAVISNATGISVHGPGALIGGPAASARNLISGSRVNGLELIGAHNAVVQGNYIGLDTTGSKALSNNQYGVYVLNANNVVIGGTGAARNVIGASRLDGVFVTGSSTNTLIAGNFIGTSAAATSAVPNGGAGVAVDANHVTIGSTNSALRNILSGNYVGVTVHSGRSVRVIGNYIGVSTNSAVEMPNYFGVHLRQRASGVAIGGTNTGERNVIARNITQEVYIEGTPGGHAILGNYIGIQDFGVPFPTISYGTAILVEHSPSNQIGNGTASGRNVISGEYIGISLFGTGSVENVVRGNYIGTDGSGIDPAGHLVAGILIRDASRNRIGGLVAGDLNLVAHNASGILVTNDTASAVNNLLVPNLVFSNAPGLNLDLGDDGPTINDPLDADTGPNRRQNYPVLTTGAVFSGGVYVQGVLTSAPSTTFAIDIFRSGSSNAEGRVYFGRTYATTDGGGWASFSAGFPIGVATTAYLTATATDPDGNTSEFSAAPRRVAGVSSADADGDGIPDYWETLYGLNPAVSNSAAADLDTDGYTDLQEYIADTAANDGAKFPVIVDIDSLANREVTFPSSSLRVYKLEANGELATNAAWTQVGGSVTGLYGQTTMIDTNTPAWRMYRVGVRLP